MLGFPIRTSADQRPVDGSPQLFAVTHVLHRFLAPRHPPLALCSLEEIKMLVLALQFSKGDAQRRDHGGTIESIGPAITGHAAAVGRVHLELSSRGASAMPARGKLPQNGREDKILRVDRRRGTSPRVDDRVDRTHQCTNWECLGSGQSNADQRPRNCSLERR